MAKESEKEKKQIPLRLSPALHRALLEWSEQEFRSLNGQIEYLLTLAVRAHEQEQGGGK